MRFNVKVKASLSMIDLIIPREIGGQRNSKSAALNLCVKQLRFRAKRFGDQNLLGGQIALALWQLS